VLQQRRSLGFVFDFSVSKSLGSKSRFTEVSPDFMEESGLIGWNNRTNLNVAVVVHERNERTLMSLPHHPCVASLAGGLPVMRHDVPRACVFQSWIQSWIYDCVCGEHDLYYKSLKCVTIHESHER
jgi:hypothetical protein